MQKYLSQNYVSDKILNAMTNKLIFQRRVVLF